MTLARIFVPQETLEVWLAESRVHMVGETLFVGGQAFALQSAVRFVGEVTGAPDEHQLVGRVKTLDQLAGLGGEHCAASVVLGDNAYEVVEGFLARPELTGPRAAGTNDRLLHLFADR